MYLTTQISLFYFFVEMVFGLVVLEFIGFVCLCWFGFGLLGVFCLGQCLALQTKKTTFVLKLTPEFLVIFAPEAGNTPVMLLT